MTDRPADVLVYTKYAGDIDRFRHLLTTALPGESIAFATTAAQAEPHLASASILYGWGFPAGMVQRMPKLKWIQKMGAGVEDLTGAAWPFGDSVTLTRTDGKLIAPRMVEYVLSAVLSRTLRLDEMSALRAERRWDYIELGSIRQQTIGVAGLGDVGSEVAAALGALGAEVIGWRRTPAACSAVSKVYSGAQGWSEFLARSSTLVLVLPHTAETAGVVNAAALAKLPRGAHLINVGRGALVNEPALIAALDDGQLSHATLDVFAVEPLPRAHPLWTHPKVTLTPHVSGPLIPEDVAPHFLANLRAFKSGGRLANVVAPERNY
ncbi:glyoxylate/hydroxypyruvate reductase A [soil metagenome]